MDICEMVLAYMNLQQFVVYNMLSSNPGKEVKVVVLLKCVSIINCKYMNIPVKACVLNIIHMHAIAQWC